MALKFRRGTTAQQSGSLAFGEPYVNTTLGTLLIGGPTGDIVLSTTGTGSTGTFGAISGSGLDITGNANIAGNLTLGGNITIGDATTDTVVINADLSSSIIPDITNVFDIGSPTKVYKNVYANNISASLVEIMSGSNPELRLNNKTTGIAYHIQNGDNGSLTIHNPTGGGVAIAFLSSSTKPNVLLYADLGVSQSVTANRLVASTISGSVSGSINGIGNVTDYSASVASKFTTLGTYTSSVDGRFTTLGTYTGSVEGRFSTLATLTGSNSTRLTNLESTTASLNVSVTNLNTLTASALTRLTALEVETTNLELATASLNTSVSNLNTFSSSQLGKDATLATLTGSYDGRFTTLGTYTASVEGRFSTLATLTGSNGTRLTNLESTTASLNTSVSNLNTLTASALVRFTNLETFSASENSKASTLATYTGSNDTKWSTLGSLSGSFARTNSTNVFSGNQTITGSLFVSQDLVVAGSSSIQNISSSTLNIGTNLITVAVNQPSVRFGGFSVIDSGSAGASGSILYDSIQDEFIFVHRGNGVNVTSSVLLMGPETIDSLGNETYLTNNRIVKGTGKEHIVDSQISDDGTTVSIGGALTVTGNITGPIRATNGVVSGSSQITYASISSIPAGIVSGSSQLTSILPAGVVSGSSQVIGILSSLNTYTGSNDTTNTTQNSRLDQLSTASGSAITRLTALEVETANLESFTSSINTTIKTRLNAETVVSGSSQIAHDSTTGYSANRHIDHTAVTITAGSGLTGGGDISATRTLSIANLGVTDAMLAGSISNAKLTNSAITIAGTSTALGSSITAATILQGTGVVSGSSQIAIASVSGYDANRWVDHTAVSISAGNGLSGGGTIAATRTLSLDTTSATFTSGVTTQNNALGVVSGSRTISGITLGSNLATLTIGTGLSGTSYNGSTAVTIANTGVTSITTNTGLSTNASATGGVTITNTGVRSIAAGTGVAVSATTGDSCSISIGQSVATSASPTFAGLTINGAITATGDITAFFTSDKRHKNNIQTIPNALEKVSKLNGVTWEWNDDVNEVTKQSPKTGLIAQEVLEVLPEVVKQKEDGFLGLDYSKMMGLLVEAIKEQQSQIEELKSKLGYN
jgi:hypothetical protein